MECSHCMIDATPDGRHMTLDTYKEALDFIVRYDPSLIFISGGEPTDHPHFLEFLWLAKDCMTKKKVLYVLVASNGMFLEDKAYTEEILKMGAPFQITNDPHYYPKRINKVEHKLLTYENTLQLVTPMGRAVANNIPTTRQSPLCFNLRSVCTHYDNLKDALRVLRSKGKMCSPSINVGGQLVAGESSSCCAIGNVFQSGEHTLDKIHNMKCGKCGLHKNLNGIPLALWEDMGG